MASRYTAKDLQRQIDEWNRELEGMGSEKRLGIYGEYNHTYIVWHPVGDTGHFGIDGNTPRDCVRGGALWMAHQRLDKAKSQGEQA